MQWKVGVQMIVLSLNLCRGGLHNTMRKFFNCETYWRRFLC
jgi:hypothetical protein